MKKIAVVILPLLVVMSCATYSLKQCTGMDWGSEGFQSALRGATLDETIAHYDGTCGKDHRIAPDREALTSGFQSGLKAFCTPLEAERFGRTGGRYAGHCPKEAEGAFQMAYLSGKQEYTADRLEALEDEVRRLKSELSDKDMEIQRLRSQIQ